MSRDVLSIEQIVAEVVRRLKQLADAPAPAAQLSAASLPQHRSVPDVPPPATPPASPKRPEDLSLDARVITTATVHGRLDGVRRVLVQPRAVITPSVKDELRKRRIRLEVEASSDCPARCANLTVASCLRSPDAVRAAATLPLPQGCVEQRCEDLQPAVECAVEAVRNARHVALVLTEQTLAAVCLLNRNAHVRAAQARTPDDVRQAVRAIGANVLAVDPRQLTTNQWQVIVQKFGHDLPRSTPPSLSAAGPARADQT